MAMFGKGLAKLLEKRVGDEAASKGIIAYHGSPHAFDRFSMDSIGTGEGAQAFGHGLYFAGNEKVAKSYRDATAKGLSMNYNGQSLARAYLSDQGWDADKTIASLRNNLDNPTLNPKLHADNRAALEYIQKNGTPKREGHMYEAHLDVNPDQLLDWDKPVAEQPPLIQDAASDLYKLPRKQMAREGQFLHPSGPDESQQLLERGVPGLQYFDRQSRGAGEGTRNYVMFDDKPISILRRYAVPGAIGAGAATAYGASQDQADASPLSELGGALRRSRLAALSHTGELPFTHGDAGAVTGALATTGAGIGGILGMQPVFQQQARDAEADEWADKLSNETKALRSRLDAPGSSPFNGGGWRPAYGERPGVPGGYAPGETDSGLAPASAQGGPFLKGIKNAIAPASFTGKGVRALFGMGAKAAEEAPRVIDPLAQQSWDRDTAALNAPGRFSAARGDNPTRMGAPLAGKFEGLTSQTVNTPEAYDPGLWGSNRDFSHIRGDPSQGYRFTTPGGRNYHVTLEPQQDGTAFVALENADPQFHQYEKRGDVPPSDVRQVYSLIQDAVTKDALTTGRRGYDFSGLGPKIARVNTAMTKRAARRDELPPGYSLTETPAPADKPEWPSTVRISRYAVPALLGGGAFGAATAGGQGQSEAAPWKPPLTSIGKFIDAAKPFTANEQLFARSHGPRATAILQRQDAALKASDAYFLKQKTDLRKAFDAADEFGGDTQQAADMARNRANLTREDVLGGRYADDDTPIYTPKQEISHLHDADYQDNLADTLEGPMFNGRPKWLNALPIAAGVGAGGVAFSPRQALAANLLGNYTPPHGADDPVQVPSAVDAHLGDYGRKHYADITSSSSDFDRRLKYDPLGTLAGGAYDTVHGMADSLGQDIVGAAHLDPRRIASLATWGADGVGGLLDTDALFDTADRINANGQRPRGDNLALALAQRRNRK